MIEPAHDMAGWNLMLRFGLEVVALVGLGIASWSLSSDTLRWVVVIVVPVAAATVWGVFNVLDDPSRSGAAPIEVPGRARLVIELLILGWGAVALAIALRPAAAIAFAIVTAIHYACSWSRVEWLFRQ